MLVTLDGTVRTSSLIWLTTCAQDFMFLIIIIAIVEERNSRHGSGGFSPERGGGSRQCDLDPSPVNFLRKYTLLHGVRSGIVKVGFHVHLGLCSR